MLGLLLKDLKILALQKRFLIVIFIIFIAFMFTPDISGFGMGYLMFISSILALSTISYDRFDNSNLFLFTLPFSRFQYVLEKYLLGLVLGIVGLLIGLIFNIINFSINNIKIDLNLLYITLFYFSLLFLLLDITIPIELKFTADKGRIVIIIVLALVLLLAIGLFKLFEYLNIDIINYFKSLNFALAIPIYLVILVFISLGSFYISYKIIRN